MIGTGLIDDETEMRQLIEQSLLNKTIQEEQQNGSPVKGTPKSNHAPKDASEFHQHNVKQHYESSCVVKTKSYFGREFDVEKHNSELMYEDLPKPITEINKCKETSNLSNGKLSNGTKATDSIR